MGAGLDLQSRARNARVGKIHLHPISFFHNQHSVETAQFIYTTRLFLDSRTLKNVEWKVVSVLHIMSYICIAGKLTKLATALWTGILSPHHLFEHH